MLLAAIVLLALLAVPIMGGRLGALADLEFRGKALLLVGLGIQVVTISLIPDGPVGLYRALHLVSYAAAAWFLYVNRTTPWLWLIGAGAGLNGLVIALNGGVMPASEAALRAAGQLPDGGFANSAPVDAAVAGFLGDVIAVPQPLPLANVVSVGDALIALGAVMLIISVCRPRRGFAAATPTSSYAAKEPQVADLGLLRISLASQALGGEDSNSAPSGDG